MNGAVLLHLLARVAGRLLILAAVCIFLAAVLGQVSWGGALALWIVLFIVALAHAGVHDTGDEGADR